ncbi:PH domain-containing protein [Demequina gelatinilytica]|uniref:PH domain-containing protein n=1 Tax=Demequina gelatinilytica TaxID=1638980 RepID=UPI000780C753|nr:PH domain-containing protein [Demequina gelatinilytica]
MSWYENAAAPWVPVSRRLITARLVPAGIVFGLLVLASLVVALAVGEPWLLLLSVAVLAIGAWVAWVIVRQVTAHAWAEGEDDLLVRKGRMFRSVTVVPYGRMQFVDVKAGPLDRALGIATVQLHTASPGTDASIAGVPAEEAARLRDRLTTRGEARLAGL